MSEKEEKFTVRETSKTKRSKETYSYKGWLNSDCFFKRALAVVGYSMIGTFIIYIPIYIMIIIIIFNLDIPDKNI